MTARAILSEHDLAPVQFGPVLGHILNTSWCVLEQTGLRRLKKKQGDIRRLSNGRVPIARIFFGIFDPERCDVFAAKQQTKMQQPLFAKKPYVDKHSI